MSRSSLLVGLCACAASVAACGKSSVPAAPDADGGTDAAVRSIRAFDVTATVMATPVRGRPDAAVALPDDFPMTFPFTFAWDPASDRAWTGANGGYATVTVATTDGRTYVGHGWAAQAPYGAACDGRAGLALDPVSFALDGDTLRGEATGEGVYRTNAGSFTVPVTVELVGTVDVTPPTFTVPEAGVDPLADLFFEASEPLPPGATASLTGATSGDVVGLGTGWIDALETAGRAFGEGRKVLRPGETYTLNVDHVADFAGNAATRPATFTTRAQPPLVPEDGFESVTGTMFAGAGVLHGGPLAPITGQTSLLLNTGYGGGFGFLPYGLGPSLSVRLAVAPGDTVVRFDSQLIAPDPTDAASFVGVIRLGTVGGTVAVARDVDGVSFVKTTLPQLGDIYLSPVAPLELPLPVDVQGEILFEIVGTIDLCAEPPSPTVLVVDNLRVE